MRRAVRPPLAVNPSFEYMTMYLTKLNQTLGMSSRGCQVMFYQRKFKTTHGVHRSGETTFEYLWREETEMKSEEPGGEPVRLRGSTSTDWIWFLVVETRNHHGMEWELEEEEGVWVLVEMTCSWSLERDGSEWIGLRGCWVTGRGKNSMTRVP
jgi:hypothetical protein